MTNLEQLKKVIWKANPSILELKFGCEVEYRYKENIERNVIIGKSFESTDSKSLMREYGCASTVDSFRLDNFRLLIDYPYVVLKSDYIQYQKLWEHTYPITKILGREIRLADVLIAWEKESNAENFTDIYVILDCWEDYSDKRKWNLHKNSLDQQSEECINFLSEILCQKK